MESVSTRLIDESKASEPSQAGETWCTQIIAAARRCAPTKMLLLPEASPTKTLLLPEASRKYFDAAGLVESVEKGWIALIRGRWIIKLNKSGGRLKRRQDLPPDAFLTVEELRRLIAALGDDWGLLLVAISYRWLTADHPGPV